MSTQRPASPADSAARAKTIEVTNPATGAIIDAVPALDRAATIDLVRRARAAQPALARARLQAARAAHA